MKRWSIQNIRARKWSGKICFLTLIAILIFVLIRLSSSGGKNIYDLLNKTPYRSTPVFLQAVIKFDNINYILKKMSKSDIESISQRSLFYYTLRKKSWMVDRVLGKSYTFIPAVNFDALPWIVRIVPDINLKQDISSLSGTYLCYGYVVKKIQSLGMMQVVTFTITKVKKTKIGGSKNKILSMPRYQAKNEEKELWKAYVAVKYPVVSLPLFKENKILAFSIPAGLKIFVILRSELQECYSSGIFNKTKLKNKILSFTNAWGISPAYISYPDSEGFYIFYEFISPFKLLVDDDCSIEVSEQLSDGKFRIWRGYYMKVFDKKPVNWISTAEFLIRGLRAPEILALAGKTQRFEYDKPLFDLFLPTVLEHAHLIGGDMSLSPELGTEILRSAGKLAIDTAIGSYVFQVTKRTDGTAGLKTNKRCTAFLLTQKNIIKKLPQFFYR